MGKVDIFTINFADPNKIFYSGQFVQGEVQCKVKKEVKIREIRLECAGNATVEWRESRGTGDKRHSVRHYATECYFFNVIQCETPRNGEETIMLQPGTYRYPFHFQIPMGAPSSFESYIGQVQYYVKATAVRPWTFDEEVINIFTVINLLDLNTVPDVQIPCLVEDSKTVCCCCCQSGPISAKHQLDKRGYVPGEAIPINAECINHSRRKVKISMQLLQVVTYKTSTGLTNTFNEVVELQHKSIPKGDSEMWTGELVVPLLPPSGLSGCNLIDIHYFLKFICNPAGPSIPLHLPIGIVIGGIPLVPVAQQACMYGAPNPMTSGFYETLPPTHLYPPPEAAFPPNIPPPAFDSFYPQYTQNDGRQEKTKHAIR